MDSEVHENALRACREWDLDSDGALSFVELKAVLRKVYPGCPEGEIEAVIRSVDINKDGAVPYAEFLSWLRMPAAPDGSKLSFEDAFRCGVLEHIGAESPPVSKDPPVAAMKRDFGCAPNPSGSDLPSPKSVIGFTPFDEEDGLQLESFTHPSLSCFSVCKEGEEAPSGMVTVRISHASRLGSLRVRPGEIEIAPVQCLEAAKLPNLLSALAEGYRRVLEKYLDSGDKGAGLLLPPLPAIDHYSRPVQRAVSPQPLLSAVALALAQSGCKYNALLKDVKVQLCPASGADADALRDALDLKVKAGTGQICLETTGEQSFGKLRKRRDAYSWCRKDNDPEARLWRLEAFMMTQRAAGFGGYNLGTEAVALRPVADLSAETQVCIAEGAASEPLDESQPSFELVRAQDMDPAPDGLTVMEVAAFLTTLGCRVAAVNAASAYQVGGGASTGGRHALEEAWCVSSTLYQSLVSVEPMKEGGLPGYRQHIPATGCIVSPKVQLFRECTDNGYGFCEQPPEIAGVVSVAMFNRNERVRDSPLDSPDQPAEYVCQTRAKLQAAVLAACETLEVDTLVIPDVGCGVFMNDPRIIGGCLGSVLRRFQGRLKSLKKVVICGFRPEFAEACERALQGKDPRELCPGGASSSKRRNPRYRYEDEAVEADAAGESFSLVDEALLQLAKHPPEPEQRPRNPCRYGATCHIRTPEHLARFSHPESVERGGARKDAGGRFDNPGTSGRSAARIAAEPRGAGISAARAGRGAADGIGDPPGRIGSGAGDARPWSAMDAASAERRSTGSRGRDVPSAGTPELGREPVSPAGGEAPDGAAAPSSEPPSPAAPSPTPEEVAGGREGRESPDSRAGRNPGEKRVCMYGEACYNRSAKHLADFAHPWLDGETADQAKARRDTQDSHELLNKAKVMKWEDINAVLKTQPHLVDMRPDGRKFALIHYAAFQYNDAALGLLLHRGANPHLQNQDGLTAADVARAGYEVLQKQEKEARLRHLVLDPVVRREMNRAEKCLMRLKEACARSGGAPGTSEAPPPGDTHESRDSAPGRKVTRTYIEVTCRLSLELKGEYRQLDEKINGKDAYKKAASGSSGELFIFVHKDADLGWSIGPNPSSDEDPLAWLGSSSSDPCMRMYGQRWKVWFHGKMMRGRVKMEDEGMNLRKRYKVE
eukprot:TRINITY_DN14762_c2_g2_i1.p1 TRINITY_DN14762_c2_g2~~TRINITY_DN14762_c2_g2_i1.p1  ORF type:complete len:1192 (-),score=243.16 TRINITY_DN14762_c2_g2_i1:140-3634(-)